MKNIAIIIVSIFLVSSLNVVKAQCYKTSSNNKVMASKIVNTTDTLSFKVSGNCGMCKARIEKAAKSIVGISNAVWDAKTGILKISLSKDVDIHEIHKAIAKAGHDTVMHKADNSVYNKLPACCKYKR